MLYLTLGVHEFELLRFALEPVPTELSLKNQVDRAHSTVVGPFVIFCMQVQMCQSSRAVGSDIDSRPNLPPM